MPAQKTPSLSFVHTTQVLKFKQKGGTFYAQVSIKNTTYEKCLISFSSATAADSALLYHDISTLVEIGRGLGVVGHVVDLWTTKHNTMDIDFHWH